MHGRLCAECLGTGHLGTADYAPELLGTRGKKMFFQTFFTKSFFLILKKIFFKKV